MSILRISEQCLAGIRSQALQEYPNECCGALLGRDRDLHREVSELLPLSNRRSDSLRNRFSISTDDVRLSEAHATSLGLEVVGWYHSHPDHPAQPSEYDREHAWPWYSYLIAAATSASVGEITSWRLEADRSGYEQEEITVESFVKV
ncbi:MAG: M67 family metallopeptidase [Acidobacteria bacterium]|nr:M67 family metallopeptidase [Acidobacteriota bacterium]